MALEDLIVADLSQAEYSKALENEFFNYFSLIADNPWAMNFPMCWKRFLELKRYTPLMKNTQFRSDLVREIIRRDGWKRKTLRMIEKTIKPYMGEEWKFLKKKYRRKKRWCFTKKPTRGDGKVQERLLVLELKKQFKRRAVGRLNLNDPQVAGDFLEQYFKWTSGKQNIYTRNPEAWAARRNGRKENIKLIIYCILFIVIGLILSSDYYQNCLDEMGELIYQLYFYKPML